MDSDSDCCYELDYYIFITLQPLPYLVSRRILQFKQDNPTVMAKEVRSLLIFYRLYNEINAPGSGAINRVLRSSISLEHLSKSHRALALANGVVVPEPIKWESKMSLSAPSMSTCKIDYGKEEN